MTPGCRAALANFKDSPDEFPNETTGTNDDALLTSTRYVNETFKEAPQPESDGCNHEAIRYGKADEDPLAIEVIFAGALGMSTAYWPADVLETAPLPSAVMARTRP